MTPIDLIFHCKQACYDTSPIQNQASLVLRLDSMDKLYSLLLYSSDSRNFFLRLPLDLDEGILSSCVGYNLVYLGRPRLRDPHLLDPASELMMRACAVKL